LAKKNDNSALMEKIFQQQVGKSNDEQSVTQKAAARR